MTARGRRPKELFLSHSDKDRVLATKLAAVLKRHGVRVWYSRTSLRGGDEWPREIGTALARCDWLVVLLTPPSVRSMWVEREVVYALRNRRYRGRIVPLVAQTCDVEKLSWALGALHSVDFRRRFDNGCRDLLAIWSIDLAAETNAPVRTHRRTRGAHRHG